MNAKLPQSDTYAAIGAILPVKDALRSIRFGLKRGRSLLDPVVSSLPGPLSNVASRTLHNVDTIGSGVDRVISGAAHRWLDRRALPAASLALLLRGNDRADVMFAQTVYQALRRSLRQFGVDNVMISERRLVEAFRTAEQGFGRSADVAVRAANLFVALRDGGAIDLAPLRPRHDGRSDQTSVSGPADAGETTQMALFAVMLWLQVERNPLAGDNEDELLGLCCDVALALRSSIKNISCDRDRLAELFSHYAGVV